MKKTKIIIPAMGMLLLGTAASVTGTVAWFSMNTSVKVSGMQVNTKVSSNLLIAEANNEALFRASNLSQARMGLLEPVSTINGTNFYYHASSNLDGNGKPTDSVYPAYAEADNRFGTTVANEAARPVDPAPATGDIIWQTDASKYYKYSGSTWEEFNNGKDYYDSAFNTAYSMAHTTVNNTAFGYMDYAFYLKATSTEDNALLKISTVNLMYNDAALNDSDHSDAGKAWRVAVFAETVSAGAAGNAVGTLKSILRLSGAQYYSQVASDGTKAATTGNALAAVSGQLDAKATIDGDIDAGVTRYYKVVVRLWLEGEDSTCNNETYALLTNSWKLELNVTLNTTNDGAGNITTGTTIIS